MPMNAALKFRLCRKTSPEQLARAALAAERGDEDVLSALPKTVKRKHVHWTFAQATPTTSDLIKDRSRLHPLLTQVLVFGRPATRKRSVWRFRFYAISIQS